MNPPVVGAADPRPMVGNRTRRRLGAPSKPGGDRGRIPLVMNPSLIHIIHASAYQADRPNRRRFR